MLANKKFWNELCGMQAYKSLGLNHINLESLDTFDSWYMDDMYPYLYDYLDLPNIKDKSVLEIGLGFGTVGQKLFLKSKSYIGVDYSKNPVKMMNYRIALRGQQGKAKAIEGDARNLPFGDNTFDMVVSIGCLHHTGDIQKSIDEVHRVLKKNGKAVIMLYNKYSFYLLVQCPLHYLRTNRKVSYSEFVRGNYDNDSEGNAAPETKYSGYTDIKRYFSKYGKTEIKLENFSNTYIPFVRVMIPRKQLLGNAAKVMGLDFYIIAQK